MNIWEIRKSIRDAWDRAVDMETGEIVDEQAVAEMTELQEAEEDKIEGACCLYKEADGEAEAIKKEIDRLKEELARVERRKASLLRYVQTVLNGEAFKTVRCKVAYRKSVATVVDETIIPKKYMVKKVTYAPDKKAIKEALEAGTKVKGAYLEERMNCSIK